ncbi:MAG: hypothetical protein U5N86_06480 [Planctomycetota bacterium]|nr:hypothetical protein [Planctomycetota bacterium]
MRTRNYLLMLGAFVLATFMWANAAFAAPSVTSISGFNSDDFNGGDITLSATVDDPLPFTVVYFDYYSSDDSSWHYIAKDEDGSDGFSAVWKTGDMIDLGAKVRAYADTVGTATDPVEETLQVFNQMPDSITGFTNPDEGTITVTANTSAYNKTEYFPPNQWNRGSSYAYYRGYTIVNKASSNESQSAGTVNQMTLVTGGSGYYSFNYKLKLFQIPGDGTVKHIWTSSQYSGSLNQTYTRTVNVPNVPVKRRHPCTFPMAIST